MMYVNFWKLSAVTVDVVQDSCPLEYIDEKLILQQMQVWAAWPW